MFQASCTIVSKGYSTSGRCRLSRNQKTPSSQSRFSSEKRRYGGYMLSQPSAPGGAGVRNGLGNRRSLFAAISLLLLAPPSRRGDASGRTFAPVRPVGHRVGAHLLRPAPVGDHRAGPAGPHPDPDLLSVEGLAGVVTERPG